jgi:hypothetical protein
VAWTRANRKRTKQIALDQNANTGPLTSSEIGTEEGQHLITPEEWLRERLEFEAAIANKKAADDKRSTSISPKDWPLR